jgi:hypothetical protein
MVDYGRESGVESTHIPFVDIKVPTEKGYVTLPLNDSFVDRDGQSLFLISMNHTISSKNFVGSTIELEILDQSWDQLEEALVALIPNIPIKIRYGWRNRNSKDELNGATFSPWHDFVVIRFQSTFEPNRGAIVTIHAKDIGHNALLNTVSSRGFTAGTPVTTVISQVLAQVLPEDMGYFVVPALNELPDTMTPMPAITPMEYINELMGLASLGAERGHYTKIVYPSNSGPLGSSGISDSDTSRSGSSKSYIWIGPIYDSFGNIERNYKFGRNVDSTVQSFTPSYDGTKLISKESKHVVTYWLDPLTKSLKPVQSKSAEDPRESLDTKKPGVTPSQPRRVVESTLPTPEHVRTMLTRKRQRRDQAVYEANLIVMGDPHVFPLSRISIWVYKNGIAPGTNELEVVSGKEDFHHSSGIYYVRQVNHAISAGRFMTSFDLLRLSSKIGDEATGTASNSSIAVNTAENFGHAGTKHIDVELLP